MRGFAGTETWPVASAQLNPLSPVLFNLLQTCRIEKNIFKIEVCRAKKLKRWPQTSLGLIYRST